jgi:uncharacterized protein YdaU (DUF1376 family)
MDCHWLIIMQIYVFFKRIPKNDMIYSKICWVFLGRTAIYTGLRN